jgi:hypothetical protein
MYTVHCTLYSIIQNILRILLCVTVSNNYEFSCRMILILLYSWAGIEFPSR